MFAATLGRCHQDAFAIDFCTLTAARLVGIVEEAPTSLTAYYQPERASAIEIASRTDVASAGVGIVTVPVTSLRHPKA